MRLPCLNSIEQLKNTQDLSSFAKLLNLKPKSLAYIIYKITNDQKYTKFKIPKKTGGERDISAPNSKLKEVQRRLADLLQKCFEELHSSKRKSLSHGFRKKHSIITNAKHHYNKRYVFNIDLEGFFPAINFGRVRGFFIQSHDFQLNPKVATVIAQIACHNNELPQGSPTSPIISNLIGHILDIRLVNLAKKATCTYSRYADDITFSTRQKEFPDLIAYQNQAGMWIPSNKLDQEITRAGFTINPKKTNMQYDCHRQMVTGLIVNRKVNIKASYYRQARSMCYELFKTGEFYIGKEKRKGISLENYERIPGTIEQLRGILNFIYNVKKQTETRDKKDQSANPTAIHSLYVKFTFFDSFFNIEKPLIVCEGKTDSVYIKCALKSLANDYPTLINNRKELLIDFFKLPNKLPNKFPNNKFLNTKFDLLRLSGGTGDLLNFIRDYKKKSSPFKCQGRKFPVIILIDNDEGVKGIFSFINNRINGKDNKNTKINGSETFYYLESSLYLVSLPPKTNEDVMIEHLFDPKELEHKIGSKTFKPDSDSFDINIHYGKQIFAEKIIKARQNEIDFNGFRETLNRLSEAIADYAENGIREI